VPAWSSPSSPEPTSQESGAFASNASLSCKQTAQLSSVAAPQSFSPDASPSREMARGRTELTVDLPCCGAGAAAWALPHVRSVRGPDPLSSADAGSPNIRPRPPYARERGPGRSGRIRRLGAMTRTTTASPRRRTSNRSRKWRLLRNWWFSPIREASEAARTVTARSRRSP
jgi:hypothetical protein